MSAHMCVARVSQAGHADSRRGAVAPGRNRDDIFALHAAHEDDMDDLEDEEDEEEEDDGDDDDGRADTAPGAAPKASCVGSRPWEAFF